jgi:hypothetical protein
MKRLHQKSKIRVTQFKNSVKDGLNLEKTRAWKRLKIMRETNRKARNTLRTRKRLLKARIYQYTAKIHKMDTNQK